MEGHDLTEYIANTLLEMGKSLRTSYISHEWNSWFIVYIYTFIFSYLFVNDKKVIS